MLTEHDVEFFRENGYLLPGRQLFSAEKLGAARGDLQRAPGRQGRQALRRAGHAALPRRAAARVPAVRRGARHRRAADRARHRAVVEPLHLQGPVHRARDAVARGQRVLERPVQRLRRHRHHLARAGEPQHPRERLHAGRARHPPDVRGLRVRPGRHDRSRPSTPRSRRSTRNKAVDFELQRGEFSHARRADRPRRQGQHQPDPAYRLHDALLPVLGGDVRQRDQRGLEDLAGTRRGPGRQHLRERRARAAR